MSEFNIKTALAAIRKRHTPSIKEEQDALNAAGRSRLDPGNPEARIARARQLEEDVLAQIHYVRQNETDADVKAARLNTLFDRLGELVAEQGDYSRAATVSRSPERRAHYKAIHKAILRDNDASCQCPDDHLVDHAKGVEFKSGAMMVYDHLVGPQGDTLQLHRCRKCGFMNAR